MTTKEAARLLGVSDARVRQLILADKLLAYKRAGVNLVYLRSVTNRLGAAQATGCPNGTVG
ncbi:helix-turn-helix domain-containing protein [Olsenella profusa]|uniref:Helix-turn-helix domain-containing protein n=1 Tax=Olsenella profusa TaxID=138595 RepID=A0ABS2F152_9ACTN|nr:helix-turn-helix domain-containing protein [Olsenella profusa]MBM6774527.1 helix-turn-helix domain-containing protein [Olsenella profusa]